MCKVRCVKISLERPGAHEASFACRMHKPPNIPRGDMSLTQCDEWLIIQGVCDSRPIDSFSLEEV